MDANSAAATDARRRDRFGNALAPNLPYARGEILSSTEDDFRKLEVVWAHLGRRLADRGPDAIFNLSGLEHGLPLAAEELPIADDFLAPAVSFQRFRSAALEHLGGTDDRHDAALFNRLTGATYATHLTLVDRRDTVVAVSASYSHPSVFRAAAHVGARLIDTAGVEEFASALATEENVSLVVLTRLAVTYEALPIDDIRRVVELARERGVRVYVDDAGGARVGPALFEQPRLLELGIDLVATGLDKYGTVGPRLGVLAGERELVGAIRARGFEMGMEARPFLYPAAVRSLEGSTVERVQQLHTSSRAVASALRDLVGDRLHETPVIAELLADDILAIALERAGVSEPAIVPFEASAALAMLLARDYGILTVLLVGLPPGTSALMFKFISPEALERFGGADAFAAAVDASLDRLAEIVADGDAARALLLQPPEG